MTMLKDIYAKKPQNMVAIAARAAQGATAPFTHICFPTRGAPKVQSDASMEDRILQVTETLYCIDLNGKPTRNHSNLSEHNPEEDSTLDAMGMMDTSLHPMEDPFHQIGMENNKDHGHASVLEDHLESLTKAPTQNVLESLVDLSTKIEFAASDARSLAICKRTVQNSTNLHKRTLQDLRSLRIIHTLTQDLMSNPICK